MSEKIKVLLVDDHKLIRDGLSSMLQKLPDITIAGSVSSGEEAINESKRFRKLVGDKQLELIDIGMIRKIRQIKNRLSVIDVLRKNKEVKINAELEKWLEIKTVLI